MGDEAPTDAELVRAKRPGKRGPRGFLGGDPARRQELVDYCVSRRAESPPVPLRRVAVEVEERFELDRTPSPSTIQRLVDSAAIPEEAEEQDHNDPPFPWKALHRSLTRRLGELNKQLEVPVLESVEAFENMADNRHVAQMSCVLPAPLALVLYQRDPDFIGDWFTWREQIANG